jgi:NTP pyrophosphatase (non-canonical NTP hydrolase)
MRIQNGEPDRGLKPDEYQAKALTTDKKPAAELAFPLLGLFGETGTLLSVVKKKQRDAASYLGYAPHVVEELGDVLWYLAAVAKRGGLTLSELAAGMPRTGAAAGSAGELRFGDLQPASATQALAPTPALEKTLLALAGEVGAVLADFPGGQAAGRETLLRSRLAAVLGLLLQASNEAGVTLEAAAAGNLAKIFDRWPSSYAYPRPFDEGELPYEQLPRALTIEIFEREVGGKLYVFQTCNGINIGDRLTDNAVEPDDYRFHDVFHYANACVLTWSPVTRALLRLKRKSKPLVDEAQDGARALLIEEGVATSVFGQAKQLGFFEGFGRGDLSFDMLKAIRQFVAGYEPEQCPLWLWEDAILQGYEAFRFLQKRRSARLSFDMGQRKLVVGELTGDT